MPPLGQDPVHMQGVPAPRLRRGLWSAIIILILLVLAGVFYYFGEQYFGLQPAVDIIDTSRKIAPVPGEEPLNLDGKLLLTMRSVETQALGIYTYDFASGGLTRLSQFGTHKIITPRLSLDGSMVALASHDERGTMQIFVKGNMAEVQQITSDTVRYKREPRWSPLNDRIVYVARDTDEKEEKEDHHVEGWSVYVAAADGSGGKFIGRGYAPVFSPDGRKLLYIKGDGLYLAELNSGRETKVWEVEGGSAHSHMKLALSPDGATLAWSDHHARAEEGVVVLFRIDSWEEFSMSLYTKIFTSGVFAAFSPDGKYLALQTNEVVWNEDHTQADLVHPQVVVYPSEGGLMRPILNLEGFDPSYLWLDYWIPEGIAL